MKRKIVLSSLAAAVVVAGATLAGAVRSQGKPFGGPDDVAFAGKLWKAMEGYEKWKLTSGTFRGMSPHGKWVRLYSTWVTVDGEHYPVIVKDNFGGRGVTPERVQEDPAKWRKSVSVMLQRKPGYDGDNDDWFWAQYLPDGKLEKADSGTPQAGRVAKGEAQGCLSCHSQARDEDYLFSNDE